MEGFRVWAVRWGEMFHLKLLHLSGDAKQSRGFGHVVHWGMSGALRVQFVFLSEHSLFSTVWLWCIEVRADFCIVYTLSV